ncbi:MAG: hypothetical protein QXO57_02580 [Candidatus Aenigmatarchaeota archaeon]
MVRERKTDEGSIEIKSKLRNAMITTIRIRPEFKDEYVWAKMLLVRLQGNGSKISNFSDLVFTIVRFYRQYLQKQGIDISNPDIKFKINKLFLNEILIEE